MVENDHHARDPVHHKTAGDASDISRRHPLSLPKKSSFCWAFSYIRGKIEGVVRKMLERGKMDRNVIEMIEIESLAPKEHLLRKIDQAADFTHLYETVEPLYCEDNGRLSIAACTISPGSGRCSRP